MPFKILFQGNPQRLNLLDTWEDEQSVVLATQHVDRTLTLVKDEKPQVVIVDFDHVEPQLFEFLRRLLNGSRDFRVIGLTERNSLKVVVKAMKMGVHEVIHTKEEPHKLQKELSDLFRKWRDLREGDDLYQRQKEKYDFNSIMGQSPGIQHVLEMVSKIIKRKWVTVLIRGETGTGKELIARAIHYNCYDGFQPFVEINCNALPENLLESELFGHEKGAFTDARTQKKGLFEVAQNGTLFLDEIGEISSNMQVKLLKALEDKRIRRLGGTQEIQINTRIIAATNRDLQKAVREGQFRSDFYYRLNVVSVHLPPLRERGEDVVLLARHFLEHYAQEYESPVKEFTPEAEQLLKSYCWPGNIRELKHTIERIVILNLCEVVTRDCLEQAIGCDMPLLVTAKEPSPDHQPKRSSQEMSLETMSLEEAELHHIKVVLETMNWNKRKTCDILGISRTRLDRKLQKLGLASPRHEQPE
ncbi:MAG: sigma 54-interacting transcriptional regulator [bacterium]